MSIVIKAPSGGGSISLDTQQSVTGDHTLQLPTGVGTAGQVLKNSSTAGTLEFGGLGYSEMPAGSILQVQETHLTTTDSQALTQNTRVVVSNLTVNITPKISTSDMLVFVRWNGEFSTTTNYNHSFGIRRDSTDIGNPAAAGSRPTGIAIVLQNFWSNDANSTPDGVMYHFLDTTRPSGTSQITYKATIYPGATGTNYNQMTAADSDSVDYERLTSTITVMEVAA